MKIKIFVQQEYSHIETLEKNNIARELDHSF